MLLSRILSKIDFRDVLNFKDYEVFDVCESSSLVERGFIFVCIKGVKTHGKDHVCEARVRGARVFVCDTPFTILPSETLILSNNTRKTMAEIAKILYFENCEEMKLVGITGTKGKTTTAEFIGRCISSLGKTLLVISTLGVSWYGLERENVSTENTTPASPYIYKTLRDAYNMGVRIAVIEVSSQALADFRVFGLPFDICVFTNLSNDHIGEFEHANMEEYYRAKRRLFSENPNAIAVVNSDDLSSDGISSDASLRVRVGENPFSDVVIGNVISSENSLGFTLLGVPFELNMGGEYNVKNAALAIVSASLLMNEDISAFVGSLISARVIGRYELYEYKGAKVIIDFAHNEESFRAILTSASAHFKSRLIAVFGSVGDRSRERRIALAQVAEEFCALSVITADNPDFESVGKICKEIQSGFMSPSKSVIIEDREAAIKYALGRLNTGDCALLLGKGHETYQLVRGKKIPFSERKIIKELGAFEIFS